VRISGGAAKGTKLRVPPGARPAAERVRRAVFSSIGSAVENARVLDLFCASGAYGLEALSRGGTEATFVDRDHAAIEAVRANASSAGFEDAVRLRRAPVARYLAGAAQQEAPFDLAFVDPPYEGSDQEERVLDALGPLMASRGIVVVESRWTDEARQIPETFVVEADRRYGDTRVLILRGEP
jgi:16S rRNA (guanine966-N2)-methyltransferase